MNQITRTPQASYVRDFSKMCRLLMLSKGNERWAAQIEPDSQSSLLHNTLTKADPGTIGGSSPTAWAGALVDYKVLANAFLATLRSVGVFDRMLPDMVRVPFRTNVTVSTFAVTGSDVGEGEQKPVSDLEFTADVLDFKKAAGLVVISEELARLVSAEALIETELRNGVIAATDRDFLAKLIAANSPIASSGDVLEDLATLFDAVEGGSASSWFFVVPVAAAAQLATTPAAVGGVAFPGMGPQGGSIGNISVLVSEALSNTAVLVDATQLAAAAEGLSVQVATHAALAIESPVGPLVSLWQRNLRGIRCERWWDVTVLRSTAVASLSGVGYSGGSPS